MLSNILPTGRKTRAIMHRKWRQIDSWHATDKIRLLFSSFASYFSLQNPWTIQNNYNRLQWMYLEGAHRWIKAMNDQSSIASLAMQFVFLLEKRHIFIIARQTMLSMPRVTIERFLVLINKYNEPILWLNLHNSIWSWLVNFSKSSIKSTLFVSF